MVRRCNSADTKPLRAADKRAIPEMPGCRFDTAPSFRGILIDCPLFYIHYREIYMHLHACLFYQHFFPCQLIRWTDIVAHMHSADISKPAPDEEIEQDHRIKSPGKSKGQRRLWFYTKGQQNSAHAKLKSVHCLTPHSCNMYSRIK